MGGIFNRYKWRRFRNRFNNLRSCDPLDYRKYRLLNEKCGVSRFSGEIESITDGHTLWVKGEDLTIPVSLDKTKCFLLPLHKGDGIPDEPEQIRWNRISTITEGAKVFIGGQMKMQDNRLSFISTKEEPLMIIFYSCSDEELASGIIRSARTRNGYWNTLTPPSLIIGALILISLAAFFLNRPAYRLTVICSFIAVFVPLLPILPPGFLLTLLCRRLTWNARILRINHELSVYDLLPESASQKTGNNAFYAYMWEGFAWILMLTGILINIAFIVLIMSIFKIISF